MWVTDPKASSTPRGSCEGVERFWLASRLRDDRKWVVLTAKEKVAVIEAMCWTAAHEEDGGVPANVIPSRIATRLIETGWLKPRPEGYDIINWKKHQVTRADLAREREMWRARKAKQRDVPRASRVTPAGITRQEVEVEVKVKKQYQTHPRFAEFWAAFPVRKDKAQAIRAFAAAVKRDDPDAIIDGAHRYADELRRPDAPKPKYAQGWLNGDRWTDEPAPVVSRTRDPAAALMRRLASGSE